MATIIENQKGFKVIKLSLVEVHNKFGGFGLCEDCNDAAFTLFFIAALNQCYCTECYKTFNERARYYPEDSKIENIHFEEAKKRLNL